MIWGCNHLNQEFAVLSFSFSERENGFLADRTTANHRM